MDITNELREWIGSLYTPNSAELKAEGFAIADRIVAEHKHAIAWVNDCDPETMEEAGWVRLPVDADGVLIHIGDVMESEYITRLEVSAIGAGCFFAWNNTDGRFHQFDSQQFTHHHGPTVEDVLREFGAGWYERMSGPETFDIADYVERYAAKLRLAGDE